MGHGVSNFTSVDERRALVDITYGGRTERLLIAKQGEPNARTGAQSWYTTSHVFAGMRPTGKVRHPVSMSLVQDGEQWRMSHRAVVLNRQGTIVGWMDEGDEWDRARAVVAELEAEADAVKGIEYSLADAEAAVDAIVRLERAVDALKRRQDVSQALKLDEINYLADQAWVLNSRMKDIDEI